jgi:O-antigen/teichoic acid export membrane protein
MKDLKEKTIRGGFARLCAQGINFAFRLGSLMILARLLGPKDFGLVGMVTAFTGVLTLFRDFGLSAAAIQRSDVTEAQISTLFWINVFVGVALSGISVAAAPLIAVFYHEPRLTNVTMALAAGFLFNALGVQHSAVLQREMRFTALAVVNTVGLVIGTAIAIGGALGGYGYWALVAMTVATPFVSSIGFWLCSGWIPGRPRRQIGIRSMIHFGGMLTLNGLVVYVATNFEKILLGRFWGVDAVGLYGRAYQLINIPTENLNSAAGEVGFAALSRLQDDPGRLRSYFLKGYSLVLALTVPITIACAVFAGDVVSVLLGPKWVGTSTIFRYLSPTVLVFAVANPLGWMLSSMGMVKRLVKMALALAVVMISGYVIGLPYGPNGVALAYSTVMVLSVVPLVIWATRGTPVSLLDLIRTTRKPLLSSAIAGAVAFGARFVYGQSLSPVPRLILESAILLACYVALLAAGDERALYLGLLRDLLRRAPAKSESLVSV